MRKRFSVGNLLRRWHAAAVANFGWAVAIAAVSFLAGSIPFGFLVGRLRGVDIRKHGSGNIGATNVGRVLGRRWGALVFAADFFKGFFPLMLFFALARHGLLPRNSGWSSVTAGIAAILGHNYTPWLGFRGGKGVATSAGVAAALMPLSLLASACFWEATLLATRIVSVSSIVASVILPLATAFFYPGQIPRMTFACLAALLGIWRHRANISRLFAGTEPRVGRKTDS